jgi:hypothetical protein
LSVVGRANKPGLIGALAQPTTEGALSTTQLAELGNVSTSHVTKARRLYGTEGGGTFSSLQMKPSVTRENISYLEKMATRKWMETMCPARSGDTQRVLWMTLDKEDFYFDMYRSLTG